MEVTLKFNTTLSESTLKGDRKKLAYLLFNYAADLFVTEDICNAEVLDASGNRLGHVEVIAIEEGS